MDAKFIERLSTVNDNLLYLFARLNYNDVLLKKMIEELTKDYLDRYRDAKYIHREEWDKLSDAERYILFLEQNQIHSQLTNIMKQ